MTEVLAPEGLAGITIRRATRYDSRATFDIFVEAAEDLARTRSCAYTPRSSTPPERILAFRASALRHDPDGFWVAEADGGLVGFGIAVQREHVWYLAALRVRPPYQSRGIGAEIIARAVLAGGWALR